MAIYIDDELDNSIIFPSGSASIEAVRGSSNADIVVLLPRGRCTEIQERQMTSVIEDNVHVYRVDGTSGEHIAFLTN